MPTQTFFNLPEEKRRALLEVALQEFSSHDYDNASISQIVARAGIAKGSIYQYFANKKEFYLYLLDLAIRGKMEFLIGLQPPSPDIGFFGYLRWLFSVGAQFDLTHPRESKLAYRAFYGDLPFREQTAQQLKEASLQYMRRLVDEGMASGAIDPEVDPDLAAYILNTVTIEAGGLVSRRLGIDLQQAEWEEVAGRHMEDVEQLWDDLVRVLEHGLARRPPRTDGKAAKRARGTAGRIEEEAER